MKILHINTFDTGGAAVACVRLHLALMNEANVESKVLVRQKATSYPNIHSFVDTSFAGRIRSRIHRLFYRFRTRKYLSQGKCLDKKETLLRRYFYNVEYFNLPESDSDIIQSGLYKEADVIHLHWVADFLDYPSFFKYNKKPLVWTLHDLAPFSGGLHYEKIVAGMDPEGKPMYRNLSKEEQKIVNENLKRKSEGFSKASNTHIVALNDWIKKKSLGSELFSRLPHYVVPNGLDSNIFNFKNRDFSRRVFGIPASKYVILFVAESLDNHRKGFLFLKEALQKVESDNVLLCAVGNPGQGTNLLAPILYLGSIQDERLMSLVYAASDVFVIPSLEDNLPNTMLEALMCGTPVIGYPVGGIAETIEDGVNGYLCDEVSVEALKRAIEKYFKNIVSFDREKISEVAAEKFSLQKQVKLYLDIYRKAIDGSNQI